ncbi:hypothetical protein RMATCC62417_13576 [Rhizopus microsporus]|nr:hypothetical protein RMATCC62417_13576 [Rhizopus microsporus]
MTKSCTRRHSDAPSGRTVHKDRKAPSNVSPNARPASTEPLEVTSSLPIEKPVVPEDLVFAITTAPSEDRSASLITGKNISKYAKFTTIVTRFKVGSLSTSPVIIFDDPSVPTGTGCNSCHHVGHY